MPNHSIIRRLAVLVIAVASCGGVVDIAGAAKLSLAQSPLFVSSTVQPNVMLLLDNSGSLANIIWADNYSPTTAYADWSPSNCTTSSSNNTTNKCWSAGDGNVFLNNVVQNKYRAPTVHASNSCSSGYYQGTNGGNTVCLKLPDPVGGGDTRYTGNYLNYLFSTYANNTDLTTGTIPLTYRYGVSKDVSTNIVNNNPNIRFGVAKFNTPTSNDPGNGGYIAAQAGSGNSNTITQISSLAPEANTPLAETFYEVTRYFRGMSSYYNSGTYTSPIQYACQKNFVLVVTDGLPTYDSQFPTDDPADVADTTHALPNWDGVATTTTQSMYPNFPSGSDGFAPTTAGDSAEGRTLFLDDLAQFGYDINLGLSGKNSLRTYTVGLTTDNNMLKDAADSTHGRGAYYTANNQTQLQTALQAAISSIISVVGDFSSVAANSTRLDLGTQIIQASFNSGNWSGDVKAYQVYDGTNACTAGSQNVTGELCSSPVWSASNQLDGLSYGNRSILTYKPSSHGGIPFLWANLDTLQQTQLKSSAAEADSNGQLRLNYLRGDRSTEGQAVTPRGRGSKLGDIVSSAPFYVGAPSYNYGDSGYASFKSTYASRPAMVYVGANDGMVHGFQASDGTEKLAYVPSLAYGTAAINQPLYNLTQTPFTHAPIVDASPTSGDVQISSNWKTVLVGGLGGGGRGIYALDITNPASFAQTAAAAASTVLWEFTSSDDGDLGYTYSQPSIVKMKNGKWAAIFGNGYSTSSAITTTGKSCLFIAFMDGPGSAGAWGTGSPATTSSKYVKLCTTAGGILAAGGSTSPNGLAAPAAVDVDSDGSVDYIYAGDELGNLWRFDVTDTSPANWKVGNAGSPLFSATDATGAVQPITERPEVGYNLLATNATDASNPRLAVYFGTGRYIDTSDTTTTATQTFYGIFDNFSTTAPVISRSDRTTSATTGTLIKQQITAEVNASGAACTGSAVAASGSCYRVTTNNTVSSSNYGWFMDLYNTASGNTQTYGERQITTPILRGGRIIFTTLIPSTDPCNPGGGGWLMELSAKSGAAFIAPVFNTNGDRAVDDNDYIIVNGNKVAVSGVRSNVGIPASPGIINIPGNLEVKYRAGSGNNGATLETLVESSSGRVGRITWREVQK